MVQLSLPVCSLKQSMRVSAVTTGPWIGMVTWMSSLEMTCLKDAAIRLMYRDFPIPERVEDTTRTQELNGDFSALIYWLHQTHTCQGPPLTPASRMSVPPDCVPLCLTVVRSVLWGTPCNYPLWVREPLVVGNCVVVWWCETCPHPFHYRSPQDDSLQLDWDVVKLSVYNRSVVTTCKHITITTVQAGAC